MNRKTPPKTLIGKKKKIAFVCSGGAAKAGAFHLGVALALKEQGFEFMGGLKPPTGTLAVPKPMEISTYVGSSAGSIIASFLAAGYSLDNIFNSFLDRKAAHPEDTLPKVLARLTYPKMFKLRTGLATEQLKLFASLRKVAAQMMKGEVDALTSWGWLKTTGIFSTEGIEQFLREEAMPSNKFQDYAADLFVVATQLNHSRKVVFGKYSYEPPPSDLTCQYNNDATISDACAASTALPFFYAPYQIEGANGVKVDYIDGEIRDTLSTHVAIDGGADLVIASHIHQPYHYQKEIGSLTQHGLPSILLQSLYLVIEQKINNHIHNKEIQRNAIHAVERYCKAQGISEDHRERILDILESELHHRRNVDTIYIHPRADDPTMFFGNHFSLSAKTLSEVVRSGFKSTIDTLRKYDFEDRVKEKNSG